MSPYCSLILSRRVESVGIQADSSSQARPSSSICFSSSSEWRALCMRSVGCVWMSDERTWLQNHTEIHWCNSKEKSEKNCSQH